MFARGRMQPAFGLLLVFSLLVGGKPVLDHIQGTHLLGLRIARLAERPLGGDIAELERRTGELARRVEKFHQQLAAAEAELWYYRSLREPSLILKDMGDEGGGLGLNKLKAAAAGLLRDLTVIRGLLARASAHWEALREQEDMEHYNVLTATLSALGEAGGRQRKLVQRYRDALGEAGKHVGTLHRLAPQVVRPVPAIIAALPRRLRAVRKGLKELETALGKFTGAQDGRRAAVP